MPPRLAVVLGRPTDASRICRVDEPDRVLRIWSLLNDTDNELHQVSLLPAAAPRLQRQLDALTGAQLSGCQLDAGQDAGRLDQGFCALCPAARAALRGVTQDPGALG